MKKEILDSIKRTSGIVNEDIQKYEVEEIIENEIQKHLTIELELTTSSPSNQTEYLLVPRLLYKDEAFCEGSGVYIKG